MKSADRPALRGVFGGECVTQEQGGPDRTSFDAMRQEVEYILLEQIALAQPDDLAFLESQVRSIAGEIVNRLRRVW